MNKEQDELLIMIKEIQSALKPVHLSRGLKFRDREMYKIFDRVDTAYELAHKLEDIIKGEE